MRVLIINSLYAPLILGGAERSVTLLAEQLAESGDDVSVVTLHPGDEETCELLHGVRVYRIPMDNFYWPFDRPRKPGAAARLLWHTRDAWNRHAASRIGRILDQEKPDIVHTNVLAGISVAVWREVKKRNIRLVHTLRDYYLLCSRSALFRDGAICERRCADCKVLTAPRRTASQMVDTVISISDYVLACHTRRGYFTKSTSDIIYNIAGTQTLSTTQKNSGRTLTFGYLGRVQEEKGIEVVLEAISHLKGSNWRLKIAGVGFAEYVRHLQRSFPDPRIEWLGFTSASDFYGEIDVTIVPSLWPEPLSRTVIETFAAGRSAICAESGGIPEIARLGRVVATYPAKQPHALALIMDRAMCDIDFWRNGGFRDALAMNLFTGPSIVSRYRAVYRNERKDGSHSRLTNGPMDAGEPRYGMRSRDALL